MRSAGCIINDLIDRKFDKEVVRTKSRPLASNEVDIYWALILLAILLGVGLFILLEFNWFAVILGAVALLLVIIYPLTKRFTYYPQLFLGLTFNFGILLSSAAINNKITLPVILLYISSIFWTLIYDTIYAYQDIEDDLKIGIKSSAIKFGLNPQVILYCFAVLQFLFLLAMGFVAKLHMVFYLMIYIALFYFLCLIRGCNFKDPADCLEKFKANSLAGLLIAMAVFLG